MTLEKRCTIEASDFMAFIYECGNCGSATRIPIGRVAVGSFAGIITRNCPQCGQPTGISQGTQEYVTMINFSEAAKQLAEAAMGRNLKLKVELRCADAEVKP